MAITRSDLLKQLLPGLNELFDIEYSKMSNQLFPEEDPAMYEQEVDFGNE